MTINTKTEIHFHEQTVMSIFFENGSSGIPDEVVEIGTFIQYVLRQCGNLGKNQVTEAIQTLLQASHQEIFARGDLLEIDKTVSLIPYPGYKGRKQFNCHYFIDGATFKFALDAVGFGWLASGVGYYAPMSIFGFAKYLLLKRISDVNFKETLAASMYVASKYVNDPSITAANRLQFGMQLSVTACERHYGHLFMK